jgi:hypothetical protein
MIGEAFARSKGSERPLSRWEPSLAVGPLSLAKRTNPEQRTLHD